MPPLLLGLSVLFWGWQTGLWFLAIPLALVLESRHLLASRWEFAPADWRKLFRLGLAASALVLVYLITSQRTVFWFFILLRWLPLLFAPLAIAQVYAHNPQVRLRELWVDPSKAKKSKSSPTTPEQHFKTGWLDRVWNLQALFFGLCLMSASVANSRNPVFYYGLASLVSYLLWTRRPKRTAPILWISLMLLAIGFGYAGHMGLQHLQGRVEQQASRWLQDLRNPEVDPNQARTQMGEIGALKLSNQIFMRVSAANYKNFPLLLRDASYNEYRLSSWLATNPKFSPIPPIADGSTWPLLPKRSGQPNQPAAQLTITTSLSDSAGILNLPQGSMELSKLPVEKVEQNQYGVVKVEGSSRDLSYQVDFTPQHLGDSPPTDLDLRVPPPEKAALDQVLQELQLTGKPPVKVAASLNEFFQTKFKYSLNQTAKSDQASPLAGFLLQDRKGHCEYFASATVLLLREAGIPARYATGYSVNEFSDLEKQYVVRGRNAHAWAIAYLNGAWQTLDTTPAIWISEDAKSDSPWQGLADWWSFVTLQLTLLFSRIPGYVTSWVLIIGLAGWLWWRRKEFLLNRPKPSVQLSQLDIPAVKAGSDSEFYQIEQVLAEQGLNRLDYESLPMWLARLQPEMSAAQFASFRSLLDLHLRYRFDPAGLTPTERQRLREACQSWCGRYASRTGSEVRSRLR